MLLVTCGLITGIAVLFYAAFIPSKVMVVVAISVLLLSTVTQKFFVMGLSLGIVAIGCNVSQPYEQTFVGCTTEATILETPYPSYPKRRNLLYLQTTPIHCSHEVLPPQVVSYWEHNSNITAHSSQRLHIQADFHPVRAALNYYGFDYEQYLIGQGIRLQMKKPTVLSLTPDRSWLPQWRKRVSEAIVSNVTSPSKALLLALLTGNRTGLTDQHKTVMKNTGTTHLLAISGLHIGIVAGIFWLIAQYAWAHSWRLSDSVTPRTAGALVALLAITGYALFTGMSLPVQRAWIMFSCVIATWVCGRNISLHSLALSACIIIFLQPYALFSVGFYLSFIATFIALQCMSYQAPIIIRIVLLQVSITMVTLPIIWYSFGVIPVSSLLVNILVIPWLGVILMPIAIGAALWTSLHLPGASLIWAMADELTQFMWNVLVFFSDASWQLDPESRPALAAVIISVAGIIAAVIWRTIWLAALVLVLFIPLVPKSDPQIVIADRSYTSALISNGHEAIVINPGRRYKNTNHAKIWERFLRDHNLKLIAIVLSSEHLTKISSSAWLRDRHPEASVITLTPQILPFATEYCASIDSEHMTLQAAKRDNTCTMTLHWYEHKLTLFDKDEPHNALLNNGELIWNGKSYNAKRDGAISIQMFNTKTGMQPTLHTLRSEVRLWRKKY